MFWALEQRQKRLAAMRAEIAAEIAEQVKSDILAKLELLADENGIIPGDKLQEALDEMRANLEERDNKNK